MKHLIDKDAVVAEIDRVKEFYESIQKLKPVYESNIEDCNDLLSFIDSLEVKDVDLEKEIQQHIKDCLDIKFPTTNIKMIEKDVEFTARRFFKLGLKVAQKGE